jgi:YHS domain-containing protein
MMTVDLGPTASVNSIARPADASPKPTTATAHPAVASRPVQAPTAAEPAKTLVSPPPAPAVAAQTPSEPPAPAAPVRPSASPKAAVVQDDQAHPAGKSESDADKRSAAYTGMTLHDADDAVTAPDPMKVSTADVSEPADRPRVAPMPAVDVEQPNKPSPQPSVAAETSSPSRPAAQQHPPEADRVAKEPPAKPQAPADPTAPKAFNERQIASEPLERPEETAAKMHAIGERVGQRGLKGFCPVALRDRRQLVDAVPVYSSTFESRRYYFSSVEAKGRFDFYPEKYAPIAAGTDVVVKAASDQAVDGTLDFAVWYKDRLFLFSSPESLEAFSLNPAPYAGPYLKAH